MTTLPATIVARGRNLFVGNLSGNFYVYETNGRLHRTLRPETGRRIATGTGSLACAPVSTGVGWSGSTATVV